MAPKSTIYKLELDIADMDRNYYASHQLTLACHPSESEERMMIGLAAFCLSAHERLSFGHGLSETEEPDLWQHDLTGEIELWVELGHPDEKRLARACGRSRAVAVLTYSASPELWWNPIEGRLAKFGNLSVRSLDPGETKALTALVERSMSLSCTIQDSELYLRDSSGREVRLGVRTLR